MNFETLNNFSGELHPLKDAEYKKQLLKEREAQIMESFKSNTPEEASRIISELNEGDFRWEDKMQRNLMNHYFDNRETIPDAEEKILEIIGQTRKKLSQDGRIGKYEKVFVKKYEGPRSTDAFIEDPKTPSDFFRNALYNDYPEEAKKILEAMRANLDSEEKIDHRENELYDYFIKKGDLDAANQVIENMTLNAHNEKYKSKEGRINQLSELLENK